MQQRKLWQKYNSTDDPKIEFDACLKVCGSVETIQSRDGIEFLIRENIAFRIRSSKDENLIEKD